MENYLRKLIRDIPDFPKKGIIFKDITPVLSDNKGFQLVIDALKEKYKNKGIEKIVAIESRGFIFGAALAYALNCGFVIVRKPGKLPYTTEKISYELEYGQDTLEMHTDAIKKGEKILLVDDLLATGGTAAAVCKLINKFGGKIIDCAFVIELRFLNGRKKLEAEKVSVNSLIQY